jgi:hypothetical protein
MLRRTTRYEHDQTPSIISLAFLNEGQGRSVEIGRSDLGTADSISFISLDFPELPTIMSRRHARFTINEEGSFTLEDLGSKNGTFVNDRKIEGRHVLIPGEKVFFGGCANIVVNNVGVKNPFCYVFDVDPVNVTPTQSAFESPMASAPPALFETPATPGGVRVRLFDDQPVHQSENENELVDQTDTRGVPDYIPRSVDPLENDSLSDFNRRLHVMTFCAICHDTMVAPHMLGSCTHSFCGKCIYSWIDKNKNTCPSCRVEMISSPVENKLVQDVMDLVIVPKLSDNEKVEREDREKSWHEYRHLRLLNRPKRSRNGNLIFTGAASEYLARPVDYFVNYSIGHQVSLQEGQTRILNNTCTTCRARIPFGVMEITERSWSPVVDRNYHLNCWAPSSHPTHCNGVHNLRGSDAEILRSHLIAHLLHT